MEKKKFIQLTKEQNIMELIELLYKNNRKEAANNIFEMAVYVDIMEKKMDSVLQELVTVKSQLHKMEEREAEKGLKQMLKKAVSKLEQDCRAMKNELHEVKKEVKAKAGKIVTAANQKGKAVLNKVSEFFEIKKKLKNIRQNVQNSMTEVDKSIGKIDAFGTGMREAGQKIANTFRTFTDKPEKEYMEKKFSKIEVIKKPFQTKKKLLSGILNCVDAAIEKTEQLATDVKQYQTEWKTDSIVNVKAASPSEFTRVAEPEFQYGAEVFEAQQQEKTKVITEDKATKNVAVKNGKSR